MSTAPTNSAVSDLVPSGTPETTLPYLLTIAWLLPLASFVAICVGYAVPLVLGRRSSYDASLWGGRIAIAAIGASFAVCVYALVAVWMPAHGLVPIESHDTHSAVEASVASPPPIHYAGDWYTLADFAGLRLSVGYYIDALTLLMFVLVTFVSLCVHVYATGYMHDELHDVTDHDAVIGSGRFLHRRGRYHRIFQYLSLFSFSMLGLVLAGNLAMVFVFWELVGVCSYFLIGFYHERLTATRAANKAFIANRVGDFGFLIGIMALWSSLGTLHFADRSDTLGQHEGLFSQLHPATEHFQLVVPGPLTAEAERIELTSSNHPGYWLLCLAGLGIFCGCVGKSAQVPLHVWLPDAMEGPTPVSALVHSATMVAAGVYLVGRCYPLLTPEVQLVIAIVGCVTLALTATIAVTEFDIKRVLAYSTISQLGYMTLALGLGGWVAGLFHLVTHAIFKGLLFLCSGAVIHSVHTNDMRQMGGLLRKLPVTGYAMLVGCLAIAGVGIPATTVGLSGYYSKDAIIEQAWSFAATNADWRCQLLLVVPLIVAGITAFYMFRLWFLVFVGEPRNRERYEHAGHTPLSIVLPIVVLAALAIGCGWHLPGSGVSITSWLEQAQPVGSHVSKVGVSLSDIVLPDERLSHAAAIRQPASLLTFAVVAFGIFAAASVYWWRWLEAAELRWAFRGVLATWGFVARPVTGLLDRMVYFVAAIGRRLAVVVDRLVDRLAIDQSLDGAAGGVWKFGLSLQTLQTGRLRTYVMYIVVGTLTVFVVTSVLWKLTFLS